MFGNDHFSSRIPNIHHPYFSFFLECSSYKDKVFLLLSCSHYLLNTDDAEMAKIMFLKNHYNLFKRIQYVSTS